MLNWEPKSDMQLAALESDATILCLGGSAGTYKSETLLIDAVQEYDNPNFHGILFRESFPELSRDLIPRAHGLYSQLGAVYDGTEHAFKWPWGAVMRFAYLSRDEDVYPHQGPRYSWIGYDESTHMTEFRVRYLLSRLESKDQSLHCRMRLATNPGGPGHAWHMHTFLGNACPHCQIGEGRDAGTVYKDATWLSDKLPIDDGVGERPPITTQFIFGKWDPKGFLPNYDKKLRSQGRAFAKQLLEGCWRAFEGQYFDIWDPFREQNPMVSKRQLIEDDWWWTFWTGSDYGFSGSAAFSVLAARSPDGGPIHILDEYPHDITEARRLDIKAFSRGHYDALVKTPSRYAQPKRLANMYLGPDSWNDRGDQHTLAGLANEVMEPHELQFTKARNDRAGGAMLIYTMLQTGELTIADTCKNVIMAIESRIHDKKEPEKVEKIIGDPYDDVWDALRYCIYSYHDPERKPVEMRVQDRLKKLLEGDKARGIEGSATQAAVQYTKIMHEEQQEEEGGYYGGSGRKRFDQIRRGRRRT